MKEEKSWRADMKDEAKSKDIAQEVQNLAAIHYQKRLERI